MPRERRPEEWRDAPQRRGSLTEILNGGEGGRKPLEDEHTQVARIEHTIAQGILDEQDPEVRRWRWENRLRASEGVPPLSFEDWEDKR